jgi:cytochrome d ubiquinol oxidase subunit I
VALLGIFSFIRARNFQHPLLLRALVLTGPLGFIALEAGWTVTEVGRQPWIIYGFMKTADAVTRAPALQLTFLTYLFLYLVLLLVIAWLFYRLVLVYFLRKDER